MELELLPPRDGGAYEDGFSRFPGNSRVVYVNLMPHTEVAPALPSRWSLALLFWVSLPVSYKSDISPSTPAGLKYHKKVILLNGILLVIP
jgi:hypothetical protein